MNYCKCPISTWEAIIDGMTKPLPIEVAITDLMHLREQEKIGGPVFGRPKLAKRWGWTDYGVWKLLTKQTITPFNNTSTEVQQHINRSSTAKRRLNPYNNKEFNSYSTATQQLLNSHQLVTHPKHLNKNDVHPHSTARHSEPGEGLSSPALRLDNNDIKQTIINNEQNESFQDDVVGPSFIIHPSFPSSLSSFLSFSSSPSFFPSPFSPPITPSLSSPLFPSSSPQPIHPSYSSSKPPLQKNKTKKVFHFKKQTLEITMTQQEQDKRKSYINAVNDKWKTYKPAVKPIKFTSDVARSICARIEENSLDEFLLTIDWLFQDKHKKSRATYLRENKYDSLETLSRQTKFASYLNFALEWKSEGGEQSSQNGAESTGDHFLDMLYGKGKYAKQSYIDAEFETKGPSLFPIGGNNGK